MEVSCGSPAHRCGSGLFLTISPPWTPLPLRLGAYSARSTERSHSITLWLVHWEISAGVTLLCRHGAQEVRPEGRGPVQSAAQGSQTSSEGLLLRQPGS